MLLYLSNIQNKRKPRNTLSFPNQFTVPGFRYVSFGIYNSANVLIRSLGRSTYQAGTYSFPSWDGKDNDGNTMASGTYTGKVVAHNIQYTWDGVIGNTSSASSGTTVHHYSSYITSVLPVNSTYTYYTINGGEQYAGQSKFLNSAIQARIKLTSMPSGGFTQFTLFSCTDGTRVYFGGYDPGSTNAQHWLTFALNVSTDTQSSFSSGASYTMVLGGAVYSSVIDQFDDTGAGISGMAVQVSNNFLFISHVSGNVIKVYHKTTGALVASNTITSPMRLAIDASDNLWVHSGTNTVQKYTVNNTTGVLTASGLFITGTTRPLDIAVNPSGTTVAIIDGSTSQQIKFYSASTGVISTTFGTANGYATDPTVSNSKFYFSDTKDGSTRFGETSNINYATDGSYWIWDTWNRRMMHFSSSNTFIEQVMTLPKSRSMCIDQNNYSRVFSDYLEFTVDHTQPVQSSWTLTKNWRYNITSEYDTYEENRLVSVTTMSNSRTYFFQQSNITNVFQMFELASTGIRATGITTASPYARIMSSGNIRRTTTKNGTTPVIVYEKTLTGFNGSNNPTYTGEASLVTTPTITNNDPVVYDAGIGYEAVLLNSTTSGDFIMTELGSGNATFASSKYHIGSIVGGVWRWKTAVGTSPSYNGAYPDLGMYDMGNGVQYPGGAAVMIDNHIFWCYRGEFWKSSEVNKWNHIYYNGLWLNTYGVTGVDAGVAGADAPAQMSGNTIAASIVKSGSDYYIYHCDESIHGGVHRWHISALDTISEQSTTIVI